MTITEFLEARIAEDEAEVQAALLLRGSGTHWRIGHPLDPARVLAECAAKRAIMVLHALYVHPRVPWEKMCLQCDPQAEPWEEGPYTPFPCPTVRALASVYADHPDYRQEWAL